MKVYNYSEARQNFSNVLNSSLKEDVIISRKDGSKFKIVPILPVQTQKKSPLDVAGIKTKVKTKEIVSVIRESREKKYSIK